ncbi:MAG: hypothetical protein WC613_01130 [Candidatus Aenigmatarchaeota archaeon]
MTLKIPKGKFAVKVYRGKEGIKGVVEAFGKTQKSGDTIYSFGYEGGFDKVLGKEWWKKATRTKWPKTKFAGVFSSHKLASKPHTKRAKVRYIKAGKGNIEVAIWKDSVRIFLLSKSTPSVIVIRNPEIARGFMNYWKFLWQKGQEAKRKL